MKTSVNIKMETEVRDSAKALFNELGLDMTTAVNMFLIASIKEQALPFPLTATTTEKAEERFKSFIMADIKQSEAELAKGEGIDMEDAFNMLGAKYGVRR